MRRSQSLQFGAGPRAPACGPSNVHQWPVQNMTVDKQDCVVAAILDTAGCARVNRRLENRAFFTRADQLDFDRLGFIQPVKLGGHPLREIQDTTRSMLKLKVERLREMVNWTQQPRRSSTRTRPTVIFPRLNRSFWEPTGA
jgi:hypothetical protein